MGMRASSAAVSALRVKRSSDGGQSSNTLSYDDSFSRARLSLNSRARLETSSTSAPTRLMAVVLLPTPPFWFTMATIVLTAGILARRLSALLSERLAVSWPQFQTGEDTVLGSPGVFRGLRGFDLSHRPQGAWAPS